MVLRLLDPAMFFGDPDVRADDPEPSLDDLLRDPVLQGLLRSDGVSKSELLDLVSTTRERLGRAGCFDCVA